MRFRTSAIRIPGYISIRRIGENDNNNNNIYSNIFYIIIISTRRRQRWRWRDTTNNAWADNEHYYHGGHTPRATRSRNRVRSRTSAGAKGQCRPGRDYTVGNVRAVRPNRRRNTDKKLRSATPRRHRPGWDIKFRRPSPYHAKPELTCFVMRMSTPLPSPPRANNRHYRCWYLFDGGINWIIIHNVSSLNIQNYYNFFQSIIIM